MYTSEKPYKYSKMQLARQILTFIGVRSATIKKQFIYFPSQMITYTKVNNAKKKSPSDIHHERHI